MMLSLSPAPGAGASPRDAPAEEMLELLEALATKLRSAAYSVGGPDVGRLHRRMDRNRSGSVELDDWSRCVRRHLGVEASEAETLAMFEAVDTDGDGLIDEDELASFLGEERDLNGGPGAADTEQDAEAARQLEEHIAALTAQLERTRSESDRLGRTLATKVAQGSSPSPRGGTSSPAVADRRRKLAKQNQLLQLRRQRMQFAERQLHEQVRNEQTRSGPSSPSRGPRADSPEDSSGYRPAVSSPRVVSYADQPALDPEPTASAAPEWTRAPAPSTAEASAQAMAEPPQTAAPPAPPKTGFPRYDLNGDGVLSKDELAKMCDSLAYSVDAAYLDGVMQTFGNAAGYITAAEFDGVWSFFGGDDDNSSAPAEVLPDAAIDPLVEKFQAYDLNSSGSLSLFEVQQLLADLGHQVGSVKPGIFTSGLPPQQIATYVNGIFEDFKDGNGSIGFAEFKELWTHLSGDQAKSAAAAGGMTPATRALVEAADQDDPIVQQFRKADLNNDGKLSQYEMRQMMVTQMGYDVDEAYVASLLELFADFDEDSDGAISLDEFEPLFTHLGGMARVELTLKEQEKLRDPLMAKFKVYDRGSKGYLTPDDVLAIMKDLDYEVDDEYLNGVLAMFGSIDVDNSGVLEFGEFKALWKHLGADQVADDGGAEGDQDDPLWLSFCKYDLNDDKNLSLYEIRQMMLSLGYEVTDEYVSEMIESLGSLDQDGNGVIDWEEFPALWKHLGGDLATTATEAGGMTPGTRALVEAADQDDPIVQQFRKADLNNDGKLSQHEIQQMMVRQMGYDVDEAYVASLLELFADFDEDSDGAISLDEFEPLFTHLGGMARVEATAALVEEAEAEAEEVSGATSPEEAVPPRAGKRQAQQPVIVVCPEMGPYGVSFEVYSSKKDGDVLRVDSLVPDGMVARLSGDKVKAGMTLTTVNNKWMRDSKTALKRLGTKSRPVTLGFDETPPKALQGTRPKTDILKTELPEDVPETQHPAILNGEIARVTAQFTELDKSKNGKLDRSEVRVLGAQLGKEWSDADLEKIFNHVDTDKSGEIEVDEFLKWHLPHVEEQAILAELETYGMDLGRNVAVADETNSPVVEEPEPEPEPDAALLARYNSFDIENRGFLLPEDVGAVLQALGYDHNEEYLSKLMETFAEYDEDGDGQLGVEEFEHLWIHLGGEERAAAADAERADAAADREHAAAPAVAEGIVAGISEEELLQAEFAKFSSNKGFLNSEDVSDLLTDQGFAANGDYGDAMIDAFGNFGKVNFAEFTPMWAHLGGVFDTGETRERASTAAIDAIPLDHPLRETFLRYDLNREGHLSKLEVQLMITDLGFDADPQYVDSVLESFGKWDEDNDGLIGWSEFGELYEYLGGHERALEISLHGDPEKEEFEKYAEFDTASLQAYLTREGVKKMMVDHGFTPSAQYLEGIFKLMADADTDNDGRISQTEFPQLRSLLGLPA